MDSEISFQFSGKCNFPALKEFAGTPESIFEDLDQFKALEILNLTDCYGKLPNLEVWPCLSEFTCRELVCKKKFYETPLSSYSKLVKIDIEIF